MIAPVENSGATAWEISGRYTGSTACTTPSKRRILTHMPFDGGIFLDSRDTVIAALREWGISYELHSHPPAHTIGDCLAMDFITPEVVICKNIFLCNRQQTQFYLMLIDPNKQFRTAEVSKELGVSRLSFAPDALLPEMLGLLPGAVSPLGLMFDREHKITLVCDKAIREFPRIAFHPCVNTETVIFGRLDFFEKVLPRMGVSPLWVL